MVYIIYEKFFGGGIGVNRIEEYNIIFTKNFVVGTHLALEPPRLRK